MAETAVETKTGLDRVNSAADRALRVLLIVMFSAVLIAALVQVAARYAFQVTVIGPEEVARYLMIACTFIAIPVLARSRNQIAVDALAHFLPKGVAQLRLARAILLVECLFLAVFGYYSWVFTSGLMSTGQATVGLEIPLYLPALTMVIGAVLGLAVTVLLLTRTFTPAGREDPYGFGPTDHFGVPGETA
jgi:TRAP-type C4-dicarboxylate transport system permease small subunit